MEYQHSTQQHHNNFSITICGLVVHVDYPFMGASPDGIISCTCCGKGVLEIKCPYSCHNKTFLERMNESSFFLEEHDGKFSLNESHAYYYQVQAQLKFCNVQYCDFVVWREGELVKQRIYPNEPFITAVLEKCMKFIKICVLPELLGKWCTKEHTSPKSVAATESTDNDHSDTMHWCYCRMEESGEMIACDNTNCPIEWFHTTCLNIKVIPEGLS